MGESISYGFLFEEAFSSSFADFTLKAFVMYTNHPSDNAKCHWLLIYSLLSKIDFQQKLAKTKVFKVQNLIEIQLQ